MTCYGNIGGVPSVPGSRYTKELSKKIDAENKRATEEAKKTFKAPKNEAPDSNIKGGTVLSEIANDPKMQKTLSSLTKPVVDGVSVFTQEAKASSSLTKPVVDGASIFTQKDIDK